MVKIELLIPLSYFEIICTSSTETTNIAHLFLLSSDLFRAHSALTMRPTDIKTIPIGSTHSDS